jgi:multidrug efflux pump subunit AcrB
MKPSVSVCMKCTNASSSASDRPSRPTRFVFKLAVDSGAGQQVVPSPGSADQVITRLNRALQPIQGIRLYMQSAQDINVGARLSKTQYQYTLVDVDNAELDHWAPLLLEKMRALPQLADVASDQQSAGRTLSVEVNRDVASRLGIDPAVVDAILYDAFGQRHVARIYTTLNQYYVILEVDPGFQLDPTRSAAFMRNLQAEAWCR